MALTFKFNADGSGYKRGLERMRQDTKSFSNNVKGMLAGAFAVTAIIAGMSRLSEKMDRIHKLSLRFGVSAETIQKLGFAAEQNGASMEIMAKAMAQGNRAAQEAANGLKTYQRAFDALNINVEEFKNLNQEDQMHRIADAIKNATNENEAMAAAQQILGRSALELLPLLKQGSEEIRRLTDGLTTMSDKQVEAAARARDTVNRIKTEVGATFVTWIAEFITGFQGLVAMATQSVIEIGDAISSIGSAIKAAVKGEFGEAEMIMKRLGVQIKGASDRIADARFTPGEEGKERKGGSAMGAFGDAVEDAAEDVDKQIKAAKERQKIEEQITAELERQKDMTRTTAEKVDALRVAWKEASKAGFEAFAKTTEEGATETDQLEAAKAKLVEEKAYTAYKKAQKKLAEETTAEEEKAAQLQATKIQNRVEEQIREAEAKNEREADEAERAMRIKEAQENSIQADSLQAAGLGGNVSAFTSDPAAAEAAKQTSLLERIEKHLQPSSGVESTPEL